MQSQEVKIASVVKVVLKSDAEVLDEVVVTAYGTAKKGTFTGSAAVMNADKIEQRQVSNVTNALAGAVAGVQVQSSNGQPGTSATIRVRGVGSINAGQDPLYVVDGVPFDGDLSSLNTADIESLTVLKDAASTALYGARGANGIIMITTKKGKQGKAVVNFDAKWGSNSRAIKNYDVLTSTAEYLETEYRAIYNTGLYSLGYDAAAAHAYANSKIMTGTEGGNGYQIYTLPEGESLIGTDGKLNPNAKLGYSDGTYYYTPDNWSDEMFKPTLREEYNLSISGSTDRNNFYASLSYLNDGGLISGSGFKRYSGRVRDDYQVNKWLKVGANVNYNYSKSYYPGDQTTSNSSGNAFMMANWIAPIYPMYVRDANGNIMTNQGRKVYDYGDGQSTNFSRTFMSISNPAGQLAYDKTEYLMDILNSSWYAEISPIKGLTITARYGLNIDNTRYHSLQNAYMGQFASMGGAAYQVQMRTTGFDQQYVANYQFSLNDINHFDITAGYDGYTYNYEEGESMYRLYLPEWAGVNPENGVAQYWAKDENGNRIKTEDLNIANQYKVATGDLLPTVYGGFGTTINAFGFDASIQLSYQLGGTILDYGYQMLMHNGYESDAGRNFHTDIRNAWTPENTNTDVPRLSASDKYANSTSTRWLTSSDYLSLNNITIGYTLPTNLISKIGLSKLRVYFTADNLALWSARKGLDPRQSFTSASTATYTAIRTISGGVSLSF